MYMYVEAKVSLPATTKGVLHGSMVNCLTHNPGVLGLTCTRSPGFFHRSVLG